MNKVIRVGRCPDGDVYCKIELTNGKLSISGVIGPMANGNCRGSAGQIIMSDWGITEYAPGWSPEAEKWFRDAWDRWHLNDMKAGTPAQEAELRKHEFPGYPVSHYDWSREVLTKAGLQPDNGYSYGSKWLREEVPKFVVDFLESLPVADRKPVWV
jgi:hypothetical protein